MKKIITISLITSVLLSNEVTLDNIVISATKVSQNVEDTTSDIQIITGEEIAERKYTTVTEVLNSMAGVGFTQDGGVGGLTKLYVRGVGGARVLVLVDGVRFQDPSSKYGADFSKLMLNDVERIELISGAQSGIWGADASAGVINIISKEAKKGFHSGVKIQTGSFNTKELGVFGSYKTDDYSAKLSINQYQTDGFSAQSPYGTDIDDYEDDGYKNRTINLYLAYNFTLDDKLSFKFSNIDTKNNNDTYSVGNGTEDSDMRVETDTYLYSLAYNKKIFNHNLSLKYNIAKFDRDDFDATKGIKTYEGRTDEIEFYDSINYREKDFVLVGASYKKEDVHTQKVDKSRYERDVDSTAVFITNTNYIDKFVITESLRKDNHSSFDDKVTGKVGAKYNFNNESYLSANYGTGYNAPSIIMILNPNGKENLNLEAEDTKSFDITAEYNGISLTYFHNTVDNLISYDRKAKQHINIVGKSTFKGIEAKYTRAITDDIFINLSYTRLSAKDKDGIELRRRVKDSYKMVTDYYFNDELNFNLNGEYVGERYDNMGATQEERGRQTGKYLVMNFVTNYEIKKDMNAYIKVNNIFNRYYQVVDGYSSSSRAFYLGFNAKF